VKAQSSKKSPSPSWIMHRPKPPPGPVQEGDLVLIVPRSRHHRCKNGEVRGKIGLCLGDNAPEEDTLQVLVEAAGRTDVYHFVRGVVVFVGRPNSR